MVYSHALADRVRLQLRDRRITEKKMFGGVAFLLNGNMIVCVWQQSLIVRLGQPGHSAFGTTRPRKR